MKIIYIYVLFPCVTFFITQSIATYITVIRNLITQMYR